MRSKFFFMLIASVCFILATQALAAPGTLVNEPLVTSAGADPNILFLLDSSGSMRHIVVDAPYDSGIVYAKCPANIALSPGEVAQLRVIWSSGKVYFRYGNFTYDWGTTTGLGYTNRLNRCFDPAQEYNAALYANNNASWAKYANGYGDTLYNGNYLNWYFGSTPTSWGSNARNKPGTSQRIEVERNVAKQLIDNLSEVRVGLAQFNGSSGARILESVDDISSNKTQLLAKIDTVDADGFTPLAEAIHEIGRYFVQDHNNTLTLHPGQNNQSDQSAYTIFNRTPNYSNGVKQASPIQTFCQKNFLIALTDGRPTQDRDISASTGLTDYDGDCQGASPACPSYDRKPSYIYDYNGSDHMDDVAMAMYDMDLRPDLVNDDGDPVKNNVTTYTIGFSDQTVKGEPLLKDTAAQAGGLFLHADNSSGLLDVLQQITSAIFDQVSTAAAVTFNGANLTQNSALFLVQFSTLGWSGNILKYSVDENGNVGVVSWDAASLLDSLNVAKRVMLTYNRDTSKAIPFRQLTQLSNAQQADLNKGPGGTPDVQGQARLDYLRGDRSNEGDLFRIRNHLLADIVHSAPEYVGDPESSWPDLKPFPSTSGNTYTEFQNGAAGNRTPMIYVGDNGGMLHAFRADNGANVLSYLPSNLFSSNLTEGFHYLTDKNYQHRFYMDLNATAQDAYVKVTPAGSAAWHTILVTGQRGGGRGYVALDITDPNNFTEANADNLVLWEFTSDDNADLGYSFSEPVIGLMNNGRWAAIFGNGYNNTGRGSAKLFIVFLDGGLNGSWKKGTDYLVIDTKKGNPSELNGLSSPAAVDLNGNRVIDRIYAGDLWGNMWAFDVSSSNTRDWGAAYGSKSSPQRLFNGPGKSQPITSRPIAIKNPLVADTADNAPNILVLFGTGKFLTNDDKTNTGAQSYYGVWDMGTGNLKRTDLLRQKFAINSASKRVMQDVAVPYNDPDNPQRYGWFIHVNNGERIITGASIRDGIVFFNTLIPGNTSVCSSGGSGWLMAVKLKNGGEPDEVVIDVNNDNFLGDADKLNGLVVSGVKFPNGIPMEATLRDDYMFVPGSDGSISKYRIINNGQLMGRISWQDLGEQE